MASNKPLVLVLGATGQTGQSIVQGLIKSGNFVRAQLFLSLSQRRLVTTPFFICPYSVSPHSSAPPPLRRKQPTSFEPPALRFAQATSPTPMTSFGRSLRESTRSSAQSPPGCSTSRRRSSARPRTSASSASSLASSRLPAQRASAP